MQAVREGEREVSSLVDLRRQQECSIQLTWEYPDGDREVGTGSAAAEAAQDSAANDYLSSFLPARLADSPSAVMTAAEAQDAKAKCMQVRAEGKAYVPQLSSADLMTAVLQTLLQHRRDEQL